MFWKVVMMHELLYAKEYPEFMSIIAIYKYTLKLRCANYEVKWKLEFISR